MSLEFRHNALEPGYYFTDPLQQLDRRWDWLRTMVPYQQSMEIPPWTSSSSWSFPSVPFLNPPVQRRRLDIQGHLETRRLWMDSRYPRFRVKIWTHGFLVPLPPLVHLPLLNLPLLRTASRLLHCWGYRKVHFLKRRSPIFLCLTISTVYLL